MTIEEARYALLDCNYELDETREILNALASSIADGSNVSGSIDIELTDSHPMSPETYAPSDSAPPTGWWISTSGSLPNGPGGEGHETWTDFEPSGLRHGDSVKDVVIEYLDELEREGW